MGDYPRPDFVRESLCWQSLDGPWSFIFDDNDIGLSEGWHLNGIPNETTISASTSSHSDTGEDIVAKIASGTQELLQENVFKSNDIVINKKREIKVPYVFQCPASGIIEHGVHEVLWYERQITDIRKVEQKQIGYRIILRFGAVDYEAKIWVGGKFVGGHRGGHVPFDIDITDTFVNGTDQRLIVRVFDSAHDLTQPRGKQYWKAQPESIFYTPSGGIWQSVWLEAVPPVRIGDASTGTVLRSNDIENGQLHANIKILGRPAGHRYSVSVAAKLLSNSIRHTDNIGLSRDSDVIPLDLDVRITLDQAGPMYKGLEFYNSVALWTPERPTLYDISINLYDSSSALIDTVHTTIGMRSLSWDTDDGIFRLNNRPYFQALFLDQGYWPETFMTPPSSEALRKDIELSKKMGFNGCRKHQKVEDPRFLYWADKTGFLVWGEMANAYAFSAEYVERFDQEWREAVLRDINHPCIVAWTPVNESWAYTDLQNDARQRNHIRSLYYATKTLDSTRPVNDNCGWEHVQTDLTTFHDYADGDQLTTTCATMEGILGNHGDRPMFLSALRNDPGSSHKPNAPVLCTEFGGVNIARSATDQGGNRDWGYTTATDPKDLLKRIEKMMTGIVDAGHICGFVYTQLTDIEQEVNGLYTPDRKEKLDAGEVKKIVDAVREKYREDHS